MAALDLRPLSLGELLDRTFFLYRRNFLLFVGIAAIPYSRFLPVLIGAFLYGLRGHAAADRQLFRGPRYGVCGIAVIFVVLGFSVAISFFRRRHRFRGFRDLHGPPGDDSRVVRLVRGKAGTIFGVMFLSGLIMIGGFIALIIPGIYLLCRISVATPAAMIEDLGPGESIRRSFDLTRDFAGRSALIYLLALAMVLGRRLPCFKFRFSFYRAQRQSNRSWCYCGSILAQVGNFIGSVLVAPVSTIGFALFYYDLRVRKEAFDLQMMMQAIGADPMPPPITGGVPSMFGRDAS